MFACHSRCDLPRARRSSVSGIERSVERSNERANKHSVGRAVGQAGKRSDERKDNNSRKTVRPDDTPCGGRAVGVYFAGWWSWSRPVDAKMVVFSVATFGGGGGLRRLRAADISPAKPDIDEQ